MVLVCHLTLHENMEPSQAIIYKIFTAEEWVLFDSAKSFAGSPLDVKDGYIHCSTEDQVPVTLAKHFKGRGPVVVAALDWRKLPSECSVRVELSPTSSQGYPHIYGGSLPFAAIVSTRHVATTNDE